MRKEKLDERGREEMGGSKGKKSCGQNEGQAQARELLQFGEAAGAVLVGKNRCDTVGKAEISGSEQHFHVEDDTDGGDTAFTGPGKGDKIEKIGRYADRKLCDHLRDAITGSLPQYREVEMEAAEMQDPAEILEVDQTGQAGQYVCQTSCQPGSEDAPAEDTDEKRIQQRIGEAAGQRDEEAEQRSSIGNEEIIEDGFDDEKRRKNHHALQIILGGCQHSSFGTEQLQQWCGKPKNEDFQEDTDTKCGKEQLREILRGFVRQLFPQCFRDQGRAAGSQHDGDAEYEVEGGIYDIGGGKCCVADKAADKDAVDNRIKGECEHHTDGWCGKPQQGSQGK